MAIKSKQFEAILEALVNEHDTEWDLERLERALEEAKAKASNKRFKLRQASWGK